MSSRQTARWAIASGILMVVGGFGPWATVLVFSVSGSRGDGWLVIVGGAVAAALFAWRGVAARWPALVSAVLALVALIVAGSDLSDISSLAAKTDGLLSGAVSPGWGLYVSLLASASLLLASLVAATRWRPEPIVGVEPAGDDQG
jgi:hypothetical protein